MIEIAQWAAFLLNLKLTEGEWVSSASYSLGEFREVINVISHKNDLECPKLSAPYSSWFVGVEYECILPEIEVSPRG